MAGDKQLNVRVGLLFDEKSLANIERQMRSSGQRLSKIGTDLSLSLSLPLAAMGVTAIKAAGDIESLNLAMRSTFANVGRSASEADAEVKALQKSAMAPGLDFEQAVRASIRLQAVGLSAEESRTTIEQLANAIAATGGSAENLQSVTVQMAQMISKGKVLSGDLRIIQENLPAISGLMKEAFGTSNAEELQKLGITGKEFVEKMTDGMTKMDRVAGGISNGIVNLFASIKNSAATVGLAINKSFDVTGKMDAFAAAISGIADGFSGLDAGTQSLILKLGGLLIAIGPLIKAKGVLQLATSQVLSTYQSLTGAGSILGGTVRTLTSAFMALNAASKAFIVIGLVTAVLALADSWGWFNEEATAAQIVQSSVNDAMKQAEASISSEKVAAESLIKVINDETASREAKISALEDLKKINPGYFGQLRFENGEVVGLTDAYKAYIANILLAAKAKKAEGRLIEIDQQKADLLKKQVEDQAKLNSLSSAQSKPREGFQNDSAQLSGNASEAGAIAARITESQKLVSQLNLEEAALTKIATAGYEATVKEKANSEIRAAAAVKEAEVKAAAESSAATAKELAAARNKESIDKEKAATKALSDALADIANESARQDLLGLNDIEAKLSVAERALKSLLDAGWKPTAVEVKNVADQVIALQAALDALKPPPPIVIDVIRKDSGGGPTGPKPVSDDTIKKIESDAAKEQQIKEDTAQAWKDTYIGAAQDIANAAFSIIGSSIQKNADAEIASLTEKANVELALAEGNAEKQASIRAALDAKIAQVEKKAGKRKKALAISEAIANTAVAVTKAIASAPPPLNIPAIVAASIAGAAQIAVIAAQPFAKGTSNAPGGVALVGEQGPELINLPRGSQVFPTPQTNQMLSNMGGGGMTLGGEFTVRGTDLVLVLERTQQKNNRFR